MFTTIERNIENLMYGKFDEIELQLQCGVVMRVKYETGAVEI